MFVLLSESWRTEGNSTPSVLKLQRVLTFEALEGLEELRERLSGELFMVLGSHLNTDLQVLADVSREHGPEALH